MAIVFWGIPYTVFVAFVVSGYTLTTSKAFVFGEFGSQPICNAMLVKSSKGLPALAVIVFLVMSLWVLAFANAFIQNRWFGGA
jgi:hypothetical protein